MGPSKPGTEPPRSSWMNTAFWTLIMFLVAIGGFFAWHELADAPERARQDQCRRTCALVEMEYLGVTEYGCACRGEWLEAGPMLIRRDATQ